MQVTSFYGSLIHKIVPQTEFGHTYEIKYVRFRGYVCISFAIFLLQSKKYIAQLNYCSDSFPLGYEPNGIPFGSQ